MFRHRHARNEGPITAPAPSGLPATNPAHVEPLDRALVVLLAYTAEKRVPASAVINPLLVAWDAAHEVGPGVAGPIEDLLTAAVHRAALEASEIVACVDEVRIHVLEMAVLSQLAAS